MTAPAPAAAPHHPRLATGVLAFCGVVVAIMQTIVVPLPTFLAAGRRPPASPAANPPCAPS
ncbi:hypothetical protein [Streptomyces sp. JH34]|uniref:hypothetical protein n=1 Tax=Streptomyces sp. JH34 TaxID=2793633 RepID=UPI0023F9F1B8|nr:hypothetical protein [Streptomyces sp. JH34]MDF6020797.1 hypothetical protein [Streptomyces sp. JH34]